MGKILIIEDDLVLCRVLRNWLERKRMQVECVSSVAQARKAIAATDADIILSDMRLPDGDGIGLLEWMNENRYRIPFIIMTQHAEVLSAVRAMKLGAEDYLPKPFQPETLYTMLSGLLRRKEAAKERNLLIFRRESKQSREVERRAVLVGSTDMSVLVRGENGTGKEQGGTLFLDEVGNLPYEVQVLLLRALQERRYRPVGGKREVTCDVRIVAATNENIEKAIAEGRFREDLYHRLNELPLKCRRCGNAGTIFCRWQRSF